MSQQSFDTLEKEVKTSRNIICGAIAILLISYFSWFGLILKLPASEAYDAWGAFGDFLGGILNPLVACLALFWLMRSIKIQKEELKETRLAAEDAAQAQLKQVQLSALTALSSSITMEIDFHRSHISFLCDQLNNFDGGSIRDLRGDIIDAAAAKRKVELIHDEITSKFLEHLKYESEIKKLLATTKSIGE